jgi:hypothetical protein
LAAALMDKYPRLKDKTLRMQELLKKKQLLMRDEVVKIQRAYRNHYGKARDDYSS